MSVALLTNYNAPNINGINAVRITANQILENMYQGLIENDGRGVTQRFSDDTSGAQIQIYHVKPIFCGARELGADRNGGNFNGGGHEIETNAIGIDVLTTFDDPIKLAQVNKDMIPIDLLAKAVKSYTEQVNNNITGMTIAGKFLSTMVREANDGEDAVNITEVAEDGDFKKAIVKANSKLDNGVIEQGMATFPQEGRICVLQSTLRDILINNGIIVIGGANYAYDIQRKGTIDAGSEPRKNEDGFIGYLDNVPVHIAGVYTYKLASDFCGLPMADIVDHLFGYVSSDYANLRAIASKDSIKFVDTLGGQGIEAQPLVRAGFKVATGYEKGNSLIMKTGSLNIVTGLKNLFSLTSLDGFKIKGIMSRVNLAVNVTSSATKKVTVTSPLASKIAVVGVTATTKIKSVSDFLTAYASAGETLKANNLQSGVEATLEGVTTGKVAYALCYAVDGTVVLGSVTI